MANEKTAVCVITSRIRGTSTLKWLTPALRRGAEEFDFYIFTNSEKCYRIKKKEYEMYGYKFILMPKEFEIEWKKRSDTANIYDVQGLYFLASLNRQFTKATIEAKKYKKLIFIDDNIDNINSNKRPVKAFHLLKSLSDKVCDENPLVGMTLSAFFPPTPEDVWLTNKYVYSFFAMWLPAYKDFEFMNFTEDDIMLNVYTVRELKKDVLQAAHLQYGKLMPKERVGSDKTGCRGFYSILGKNRGNYIKRKYPNFYNKELDNVKDGKPLKAYQSYRGRLVPLEKIKNWDESKGE